MMMTGKPGCLALTACSSSRPDSPGMRISETRTCGVLFSSASIASRALEKLLVARFSRASAFSNTQRIDSSSSTIQIGFICLSHTAPLALPCWTTADVSWQWYQYPEVRTSRPADAFDHTHMLLHEGLRQSQP